MTEPQKRSATTPWTLRDIQTAVAQRGLLIDDSTLRYQCRSGSLARWAKLVGRQWKVPARIAADFAATWRPRHRWTPQQGDR